jgi:hypothetical protein
VRNMAKEKNYGQMELLIKVNISII